MSKNIYSLVLSDDVIRAIDQQAYEQNTSRSNLINQILAEHLSLATPEMQMREIFSSMERMMSDTLQILSQSSEATRAIRSQLRFKYKPTIRYQVELYREAGEALGQCRISLRTQNQQLIDLLDLFFRIWTSLEQHYFEPRLGHAIRREIGDGYMIREIYHPAGRRICSGEDVGNAIAAYVELLDRSIKQYFAVWEKPADQIGAELETLLRQTLSDPAFIIL